MRPDFDLEATHGGRVAGVDEAGRGPLAGPVVAAAVVFPHGVPADLLPFIDDSKKLSAPAREHAARLIIRSGAAETAVAAASVPEIEHLNILRASLLAMRRAVLRLPRLPDLVLVDGNQLPDLPCPARTCIRGDAISLSIAAASILAKVVRDRAMARLAARHPGYGWDINAGYGTPQHREALRRLGAGRHHRRGFGTVRRMLAGAPP